MNRVIVKGKEKEESVLFKLREDNAIVFKEIPFHNYFFIKEEDYEGIQFSIKNYVRRTEIIEDRKGEKFAKLILSNNTFRYFFKKKLEEEEIEVFEGDIDAVKRFLICNQHIPLHQKDAEHLFFDIETDDRKPFDKDFKGNIIPSTPVMSIAFKDKQGNVMFFRNGAIDSEESVEYKKLYKMFIKDRKNEKLKNRIKQLEEQHINALVIEKEKELLEKALDYLSKYDITLSYNGWRFDVPYMKERCKIHSLNFDDTWTLDLDHMEVYKKNRWGSLKSYSLQNVSLAEFENEIGKDETKFDSLEEVTKIDWKEKTDCKKYWELYWCEEEIFREYNIQDVNLMYLLEDKLNYMALQNVIGEICHCPLVETIHNSKSFDYAMLNEYHKENLIAPSKPSKEEIERRKQIHVSGGYTYCFLPGFHKKVGARDYKSFYPTIDVTFNMSPETFVKEEMPDLLSVFSEVEVEYILFCKDIAKDYFNAQGELNKNKYEKIIEEKRKELNCDDMKTLMFRFVRDYKAEGIKDFCKKNDYVFTPADINYDTRGWDVHPHRVFLREEGIFPRLSRKFLQERDAVKYKLKEFEYGSADWWQHNLYQLGLKTLGNSGYGAFAFKSFRFFMKPIADGITSSCRFIMKKSILFAQEYGFEITHGDTDSCYMNGKHASVSMEELDYLFYDYYKEFIKDYNTSCEIELINPKTEEKEINNHFIVFEFEKELESVIVVKKKRYYYKEWNKDAQKFIYGTQGGAHKKTDTMPLAAEYQKELCKNILDEEYDSDFWYSKIKELKEKVINFKLEESQIMMTKGINNRPSEYGGPVIDGKTGAPKIKADGTIQQRPIPCHIKIAKEMMDAGEEIEVGDKIDYVIIESKPRQVGISLKEFRENPRYDVNYYWERIESPLLEILRVVDKENVYDKFWELWSFAYKKATKKQLEENPEVTHVFNETKRKKLKEELNIIGVDEDDE